MAFSIEFIYDKGVVIDEDGKYIEIQNQIRNYEEINKTLEI